MSAAILTYTDAATEAAEANAGLGCFVGVVLSRGGSRLLAMRTSECPPESQVNLCELTPPERRYARA